ncbi:hypothetical protein [Paracoccus marinus]|uniref:hypothetical protein n=1 Tax=Paracoccus marinus TaxID=288426 RepID=UPI0010399F14|nr:hypothetical protein [Paracoccus marinus]GLS80798.1 hypothetical protein GCM10007893_15890 [Paracoccus marinus]
MWLGAGTLLSTAMVASAIVPAMDWGDEDILALAALLLALCGGVELAVRTVPGRPARTAAILAIVTTVLLVFAELAVGILH